MVTVTAAMATDMERAGDKMSRDNQDISEEKREINRESKDSLLDIGLFVDMGWGCISR